MAMIGDRIRTLIEQLKREQPSLAKDPTFGALEEEVLSEAPEDELEGAPLEEGTEESMPEGMEGLPKGAKAAEGPVPGIVGDQAAEDSEAEPEDATDTTGLYSSFAMGGAKGSPEEEDMNEFSPKYKGKPKSKSKPMPPKSK